MITECVLDFESHCTNCGECEICDINRDLPCTNCMKCVLGEKESRFIKVDEIRRDDLKCDR